MTLTLWLSLVAACLVISLTPGAGAVNTMTTSLLHGWKKAFFTVMGQQLALVVQIAIVAAGLGVVVANSPVLFDVIRYGGAAYLVYLGLRMILARPQTPQQARDEAESGAGASAPQGQGRSSRPGARLKPGAPLALFNRGFWVNMSNPKAIVFILAFMPQFVRPDTPQLPQYLVLAGTMVVIDIVVMWGGFAVVAKSLTKLSHSERGQRILNRVFGSLFILVAALMVFSGH
ncbi:LysE family transporter [Rothia nasimurium]|uniref:LysE family transporter n=1 Tax=Rothia nasimurium TaxID=85336 RepID=UPI001F01A006|nr:LysE family transporter [Rothia nasimurium]